MLRHTTQLISLKPELGRTFSDVVKHSSGSAAGFSVNSEWLTCPEKSRLRAAGIRFKGYGSGTRDELNALEFGTLIHELLRYRVWFGHEAMAAQLEAWKPELMESYTKAALMMGAYNHTFPYDGDPLRYVGIECEVVTNIRMGDNDPRPCFRSVRYDALVLANAGGSQPQLYSLERKTSARTGGTQAYWPQGMVQMAIWNNNKELVAQHGPMQGVIFEVGVKTKMPSWDRKPEYFSPQQQKMALDYMRLAENGGVVFQQLPDGSYPKMLHACWGKYAPCDYISLCHEGVTGDYMQHGEELR